MKNKKLNRNLIIGLVVTSIIVLIEVISVIWLPYDPDAMDAAAMNKAPSLAHIFGTDNFGRDVFVRVVEGAKVTFAIAIGTLLLGGIIGSVIGALTGYFGGPVDEILMRINDSLASFPSILLALVVVSLIDKGTWNIVIALGLVFIPSFARIMRAEFREEVGKDYVSNARLLGASHLRIMALHIFPNTLPTLLSSALIGINNAVLAEAGLSYLGLGVQPPDASLGRMLAESQSYIYGAPWYALFTGLYMVIALFGVTLIGDNLGKSGINVLGMKKKLSREFLACGNDSETGNKVKNGEIAPPAVSIEKLNISFIDADGIKETIHDLTFSLKKGEVLGLVGESGSGKSLTSLAIMGLLQDNCVITGGRIILHGKTDLTRISEEEYCKIRGSEIAMIFQEPMTSLNPLQTIGTQIDEVLDLHEPDLPEEKQRERVLEALSDTGLHHVERLYDMYPHQLSGGMRQRVCIAMALIAKASVIIADEPTTALDANIQDVILDLLKHINRKYGVSIILISHDLRVISRICERTLIMQQGRLVEEIDNLDEKELAASKGVSLEELEAGEFEAILTSAPASKGGNAIYGGFSEPETEYGKRLLAAAFAENKVFDGPENGSEKTKDEAPAGADKLSQDKIGYPHLTVDKSVDSVDNTNVEVDNLNYSNDVVLTLSNVCVSYKNRNIRNLFKRVPMKEVNHNISFEVYRGDVVGIVGESGCGKSTLMKAIAGLQKYVTGDISYPAGMPGMVFQDPYSSLNPYMTVRRLLMEPMLIKRSYSPEAREKKINDIIADLELAPEILDRRISELSGGQRQRIAIALTLIQHRNLILLDEPVSALDVTIQEQILRLLAKLKDRYGLTLIFISHDMRLIRRCCNRVFVMEKGRIKETEE